MPVIKLYKSVMLPCSCFNKDHIPEFIYFNMPFKKLYIHRPGFQGINPPFPLTYRCSY